MARPQRTVPGDHQVGFHVIRTLLNRDEVAGERVFRHIPAGAAVRYDKWPRIGSQRAFRHENCAHDSAHDVTPEWPAMRSFIERPRSHRSFSSPGFSNRGMAPMKSIIRGLPELTVRKLACLSLGLAL